MAWNDVGHGADAVAFWQWRSALNGQEQYHGVLVGPDGTPVPVYEEAKQIGAEFERAATALADTTVDSQIAILHDYESRWAINWQRHNSAFDPVDALVSYYGSLRALARSVDIVAGTAPLSRYKLVVAPAFNLVTPEAAKNLESYVRGGGHLVLTQRSAMKDEDNSLYSQRQPGPLSALLGARVEQWSALDKPVPIDGEWGSGENRMWAEQLSVNSPETKTLMRYGKSNGWLDGQPAAVTRSVGKGSITYIGTGLEGGTMKAAATWMMKKASLDPIMSDLPDGVDLAIRSGNGKRVYIFTNYGTSACTISLPSTMEDVLVGGSVSSVTLPQYGVAVLR